MNPQTAPPSVSSKVLNAVAVPMSTAHTTQEQTVAAAAISHIRKWSDNFMFAFYRTACSGKTIKATRLTYVNNSIQSIATGLPSDDILICTRKR